MTSIEREREKTRKLKTSEKLIILSPFNIICGVCFGVTRHAVVVDETALKRRVLTSSDHRRA